MDDDPGDDPILNPAQALAHDRPLEPAEPPEPPKPAAANGATLRGMYERLYIDPNAKARLLLIATKWCSKAERRRQRGGTGMPQDPYDLVHTGLARLFDDGFVPSDLKATLAAFDNKLDNIDRNERRSPAAGKIRTDVEDDKLAQPDSVVPYPTPSERPDQSAERVSRDAEIVRRLSVNDADLLPLWDALKNYMGRPRDMARYLGLTVRQITPRRTRLIAFLTTMIAQENEEGEA